MTRQENPNFVASKYAPNPKEVSYQIVDAIPEADSQVTGVLYIKLSTAA